MRDYIASLAEKCAGTSLTDGQKDFVLDYVKTQLTEGHSLVAEAVNAMDEHKVEFGLNIDWDALEAFQMRCLIQTPPAGTSR